VALGGLSLSEVALISRPAKGMAVAPIFGRPTEPDEKTDVFVLMPFKKEHKNLYANHITKMVQKLGLTIRRADAYMDADRPFIQKIWSEICNARLIVADCTDRNPNVFYEIGMAHTVGKTVVLITRSQEDIPSDIKQIDYLLYDYDPEGVESLLKKLREYIVTKLGVEVQGRGKAKGKGAKKA
jgi:hypothetical protein